VNRSIKTDYNTIFKDTLKKEEEAQNLEKTQEENNSKSQAWNH
jgi:hypothetical protein